MSLNHIILDSVPDEDALDVKFNDVEILGKLIGVNFDFPRLIFNQSLSRMIYASDPDFVPFFVDADAIGSRTIPANTLKVGSIVDVEIKGEMFNELPPSGGITSTVIFSIGTQLIEVTDIPFNQIIGTQQFSCKVKVHIRNTNLLTVYLDWDSPNASSVISVKSASETSTIPFNITVDNNVLIQAKIVGSVSNDVWLKSTYGTITIQ
jgi:hypothetical protein